MYPSMGYGCCGRRSGDARRLGSIMLLGHAAFGAGIGLWTAYQTQGMKRPRHLKPVVLVVGMLLDQPGLFAAAFGVEEYRREAHRQQGERRREQCPAEKQQQRTAIHRVTHHPVDAVLPQQPVGHRPGEGRELSTESGTAPDEQSSSGSPVGAMCEALMSRPPSPWRPTYAVSRWPQVWEKGG